MTQQLQQIIDTAWDNRANFSAASAPQEVRDAVEHVIAELNVGKLRVATRQGVGQWTVNQWIKKGGPAVLPPERQRDHEGRRPGLLRQGPHQVLAPVARGNGGHRRAGGAAGGRAPRQLHRQGRDPHAQLREHRRLCRRRHHGRYLGHGRFLRQVGKNVHLSGGVGLGGVLEPLQANPTIIEDNCFIGARSEVVEA
jgi:2,3,4,5-tetrahydropyridine-2-carboxylate N-succinyltransferase